MLVESGNDKTSNFCKRDIFDDKPNNERLEFIVCCIQILPYQF